MKRAALYLRVSTARKSRQGHTLSFDQNPEVQAQPLRELVAQRGWVLHRLYSDRASGAKERRPGLDSLMADARRGLFDVVVVWRFDRFARSVRQLVLALEEFRSLGIDFVSHQEALDTSTPMGRAMFTIIAAMAEVERSVIRERVVAGLDYARQHGTKSGKTIGRPRRVFDRQQVLELRRRGMSWPEIARRTGAGQGTVRRGLPNPHRLTTALPKPHSGGAMSAAGNKDLPGCHSALPERVFFAHASPIHVVQPQIAGRSRRHVYALFRAGTRRLGLLFRTLENRLEITRSEFAHQMQNA